MVDDGKEPSQKTTTKRKKSQTKEVVSSRPTQKKMKKSHQLIIPEEFEFVIETESKNAYVDIDKPLGENVEMFDWDNDSSWEYPMFSRIEWRPLALPSEPSLSWYYNQRIEEENRNLEKKVYIHIHTDEKLLIYKVIFRALPDFNKAVTSRSRMNITRMDDQLWKYWLFIMNSRIAFDTKTIKKFKYPDHGFWREEGN